MAFHPVVNKNKCIGCEECLDVCPVDIFEMVDKKAVLLRAEECLACESCVEVCTNGAVSLIEN